MDANFQLLLIRIIFIIFVCMFIIFVISLGMNPGSKISINGVTKNLPNLW